MAVARAIALTALAMLLSACSKDSGPAGPVAVASVSVTPDPATVRVGETVQLSATLEDDAGKTVTGRTVTWTSVNSAIASVTSNGLVAGVAEGATTVSAVSEGASADVQVTVAPARVASVDVRPANASVLMGETLQMTATARGVTGTPLIGRAVTWASSDDAVATVSPTGLVSGVAGGEVTITATVDQQSGGTALEVIDPTAPRISAVTPFPMVEGEAATATGVNFGATAGENAVTVDGVAAVVTQASTTSITFTVPETGCQPEREVSVRVTAGGKSGEGLHLLAPAAFTEVGVGEQAMLGGSGNPCVQLGATGTYQSYLIGVQSTSDVATALASFEVTGTTGLTSQGATSAITLGPGAARPLPSPAPASASAAPAERPDALPQHTMRHMQARDGEVTRLIADSPDLSAAAAGALPSTIPSDAAVGQTFAVRVPSHFPGSCSQYSTITAELRVITDRGFWLVDQANPAGGYTDEQLTQLATDFETGVAPALEAMFGPIPDTDGDGRIAFVATSKVNDEGWLSYVSLHDYELVGDCEASNEGDWGYLATPSGTTFTASFLLSAMPYSLSHDFTHVIQNRAVIGGGARTDAWIEEGQATLGEEIYAHAVGGRQARSNYDASLAFSTVGQIQPYHMVPGLAYYFGFVDPNSAKAAGAPQECSWVGVSPGGSVPGPCDPEGAFSGAWAFLRWLTDQYGAALGGDDVLQKGLIDASGTGFARVETLIGVPIGTLLARFAASLYVDDRPDVDIADATLEFPSWNLYDVQQSVYEQGQLAPHSVGFSSFTDAASVRAGSTAYYLVSGGGRPATAIEVTGPSGGALGPDVQAWVVRLQ